MAMMMTGRVLLVCALCVLWCGTSGRCDDAKQKELLDQRSVSPLGGEVQRASSESIDGGPKEATQGLEKQKRMDVGQQVNSGVQKPPDGVIAEEDELRKKRDELSPKTQNENELNPPPEHVANEQQENIARNNLMSRVGEPTNNPETKDSSKLSPPTSDPPVSTPLTPNITNKTPPVTAGNTAVGKEKGTDVENKDGKMKKTNEGKQQKIQTQQQQEQLRQVQQETLSASPTGPVKKESSPPPLGKQQELPPKEVTTDLKDQLRKEAPSAATHSKSNGNNDPSFSSATGDAAAFPNHSTDKNTATVHNDTESTETVVTEEDHQREHNADNKGENTKNKNIFFTNHTTNTQNSDGSTAVSHTTSPLLLLLFVAAAAAAVVAA
ncbi:mucin-associated surface protein (MASP) [Trypanosoma cruzi Dm28c]|uniref:Mucin-associated surface protein (MASP) n=2 Tax=Trypanosoma cruzi TaxID=5693 RepID=V5B2L6_TRYCR|nr:mucin-associated surface protein (MASP) [Trypanosoma cruzi Dm28c]PBJ76629.1 mucin-associated surface protein [Trypanosoma cruzi cruzi]PWV03283.1 Mucin-associated surface protein (MASP) [Trypanosoma cruzi]